MMLFFVFLIRIHYLESWDRFKSNLSSSLFSVFNIEHALKSAHISTNRTNFLSESISPFLICFFLIFSCCHFLNKARIKQSPVINLTVSRFNRECHLTLVEFSLWVSLYIFHYFNLLFIGISPQGFHKSSWINIWSYILTLL